MILTDIYDLMQIIDGCKSAEETAGVLDEYGEDCDAGTARRVFDAKGKRRSFEISENSATLGDRQISCPHCKTSSPDKLIGSSAELLSGAAEVHFGCCECGTQFTL